MSETTRDNGAGEEEQLTWLERLRDRLRLLYHGHSLAQIRFQRAVLLVDLAIIAFFIASPLLRDEPSFLWIDYSVALLLGADVTARALASNHPWRWLRQPTSLVDIFVLVTLLLPAWFANFGFLRILRLWTLSRSGFLWQPLRRRGLVGWEDTARATVNLLTFVFVITGFVYTFFARRGSGIDGYVDALYFTITSMTTTGYGDITLPGTFGKLTSIAVMIVGISLFVRLAQALFRPNKVYFPCPNCGLNRHDKDAVHCKACGETLAIPDEGR
ncbi:MAG TPA: ion channel [Devosiaceae bacterium]|jgi:voltage-gated potassium channel|nr:ion channel [Devosiaceae bacterium]